MATLKVLGIMSGTSLDGVDFVKIKINKTRLKCEYLGMESFTFPAMLKKKLLRAAQNEMNVAELSLLNHELGRFYADCFKQLPKALKLVDLIGLHGQTVFHQGKVATSQIGEPSYLALTSGKKVVSNFRSADIAAGGEGAPLAPFFHQTVFGDKKRTVSLHNLGGISNLSLIVKGELKLGFDTGPANMLIDEEVRRSTHSSQLYDKEGKLAARGKVNVQLLVEMLNHPYFTMKPPKSCGREQFGKEFYSKFEKSLSQLSLEDRVATLTEFTVQSVAKSYIQFCRPQPHEIIFCGGGAKNKFLIKRIDEELESIKVSTVEDHGWPTQSIEGAAFALLAACCVWKIPANLPKATSAKKKVVLGQITEL